MIIDPALRTVPKDGHVHVASRMLFTAREGAEDERGVHLVRPADMLSDLRTLHEGRGASLPDDLPRRLAIERALQVAVQAVLDVRAHLVAAGGGPVPDDYRGVILALGPLGIVPLAFAQRLAPMAGFRNVHVHACLAPGPAVVRTLLDERLPDLEAFDAYVMENLEL